MDSDHMSGVWPNASQGRGVVAYHRIVAKDCLERANTIQFDASHALLLKELGLSDLCFAHPADPDGALLVLGLASLCSHSNEPNTETIARKDGAVGWVVEMIALRDILPGEEVTRGHACDRWFDLDDEDDDDQFMQKLWSRSHPEPLLLDAHRKNHCA